MSKEKTAIYSARPVGGPVPSRPSPEDWLDVDVEGGERLGIQ